VLTDDHRSGDQSLPTDYETFKLTIMRVMCVTLKDFTNGRGIQDIADYMAVGDEFNLICKCVGYGVNDEKFNCYELEGINDVVFDIRNFAIMPEADADQIEDAEREAIVPSPVIESDILSIEEKALAAYFQTYELTGCEVRAAEVYYQMLQNPMP
jgi:hypothetical protein